MDREVIDLPQARVELEARSGYILVIETGELRTVAEVRRYTTALDRFVTQSGQRRLLIDARGEVGDPAAEVRNAMWEWLVAPERPFDAVAFVLPNAMAVARVNMTALAHKTPARAFETISEAQRWLTRGSRTASLSGIPAVRPSSPVEGPGRVRRSTSPPPTSHDDDDQDKG